MKDAEMKRYLIALRQAVAMDYKAPNIKAVTERE